MLTGFFFVSKIILGVNIITCGITKNSLCCLLNIFHTVYLFDYINQIHETPFFVKIILVLCIEHDKFLS